MGELSLKVSGRGGNFFGEYQVVGGNFNEECQVVEGTSMGSVRERMGLLKGVSGRWRKL